jgi:type IV pilus assembly protein PilA
MNKPQAFTLIEILVVIGMIAVLATIVIVAINPARQFAASRNTQRLSNVNAILNAIGENMSDNGGLFNCPGQEPTTTAMDIKDKNQPGEKGLDLMPCLVPNYLSSVLYDPKGGSGESTASYDTLYSVSQDDAGRITVAAPGAELGQTISVSR